MKLTFDLLEIDICPPAQTAYHTIHTVSVSMVSHGSTSTLKKTPHIYLRVPVCYEMIRFFFHSLSLSHFESSANRNMHVKSNGYECAVLILR